MLRPFLVGLGLVLVGLSFVGWSFTFQLALAGWGLILAVMFEQRFYKRGEKTLPGAGWQRTEEQFFDPQSGEPLTVYVKPETGERRYVRTGKAGHRPS